MKADILARVAAEPPCAETLLELAEHYESVPDLVPAFGYYLIALSLVDAVTPKLASKVGAIAFKLGEHGFALKCFRMTLRSEADADERERSARAITNLFKASGFDIQTARPAPFELALPALLAEVPGTARSGAITCLAITAGTDLRENGLLSIADSNLYRGLAFNFAAMAQAAPSFNADLFLLYLVRDLCPAVILFRHANLTERGGDPRVETLLAIRRQTKVPVIGLYYDIAKPSFQRICQAYLPGLDGVVTWDRPIGDTVPLSPEIRVRDLWTPLPSCPFRFRERQRNIDIGFVGRSVSHYVTRHRYLDGLAAANVQVTCRGETFGGVLSVEDMVAFLQSCKIVLNFSSTPLISPWEGDDRDTETDHVKGRVFEAIACGALLFETRNDFTRRLFMPDKHYVEFSDLEELTRKLAFYLENDTERERIAQAVRDHYLANYTSAHYWRELEDLIVEITACRSVET